MKTITQYQEDIQALMAKMAEIDAQCVTENREPLGEEIILKNEMLDEVESLRTKVATMERQERMSADLTATPAPKTTPGPKAVDTPGMTSRITVRDKDKFGSLGEQMAAIMRAGSPGGHTDPRLFNAASGLGETVSSDGGFLVQSDFSSTLLEDVFQTGKLAAMCRKYTISSTSNGIKIPGVDETSRASTRSGGIVSYWIDEAAEKTASKPKFRMIELSLKKLIGLCYATDELMTDASALESYVRGAFASEFGFQVDDAIINGTGAGKPLGILNAGCLVSVAKEAGQKASTVLFENVVKMYSRLFATSRTNAVWLINQNIEPQLFSMSLAVGTGGVPVYMPAGGVSGQPYGTLFGRPVIPIEQAATLGTVGDIMLCDFQNGYVLAEKGGIQTDMSIHVRFVYDESCFRFVLRIDGQPVRQTALTPYKGGANFTQSHFVSLATRS